MLARAQAIGEKIFGTSTRLKNNLNSKNIENYRTRVGKDETPEEIGQYLLQSSEEMYRSVQTD